MSVSKDTDLYSDPFGGGMGYDVVDKVVASQSQVALCITNEKQEERKCSSEFTCTEGAESLAFFSCRFVRNYFTFRGPASLSAELCHPSPEVWNEHVETPSHAVCMKNFVFLRLYAGMSDPPHLPLIHVCLLLRKSRCMLQKATPLLRS